MIKSLHLKNFAAFKDLRIDLSPRINILLGENGTGKTQLLKAAYGLCHFAREGIQEVEPPFTEEVGEKIHRLFFPAVANVAMGEEELLHVPRNGAGANGDSGAAEMHADLFDGSALRYAFPDALSRHKLADTDAPIPVFIPSKEVLTLASHVAKNGTGRGLLRALFDDGHLDLVDVLLPGNAGISEGEPDFADLNPNYQKMCANLAAAMHGVFVWKDGDFFLQHGKIAQQVCADAQNAKGEAEDEEMEDGRAEEDDAEDLYMDFTRPRFVAEPARLHRGALAAEGYRKIGVLQRLIATKKLGMAGGMLIWDEPEANINPSIQRIIAHVLLDLSRGGTQIILATHDDLIMDWLDLLSDESAGDDVMFHALHRDAKNGQIKINSTSERGEIEPNAIDGAWRDVADLEIRRSMGNIGK